MQYEPPKVKRLEHCGESSKLDPELVKYFAYYIKERESIRLKKEAGNERPWTEDPILQKYKFTNVKRFYDKTTQYFYFHCYNTHRDRSPAEIAFNCAALRYFGSIDFAKYVGWTDTSNGYNPNELLERVYAAKRRGATVFTGAYVITNSGISRPKEEVVADTFLVGFWNKLPEILAGVQSRKVEQAYQEIIKVKGFGGSGFMAKEALEDMKLTPLLELAVDYDTFTPVGPGANRGLNRLYKFKENKETKIKYEKAVEAINELREYINSALGMRLSAHDIQFCLCEFDKYCRVYNGEGRPRGLYKGKDTSGFF